MSQTGPPPAAWDADAAREFARPPVWRRVIGRVERHFTFHLAPLAPAVERAIAWLQGLSSAQGLATAYGPGLGDPVVCPGTTAAAVTTLASYGERPLAVRWFEALARRQRPDGAIPDTTGQAASLFNTGRFVAAGLSLVDGHERRAVLATVAPAAHFLAARIDGRGCPLIESRAAGSLDTQTPLVVHLAWAPALLAAAEALDERAWRAAAERMIGHLARGDSSDALPSVSYARLAGIVGLTQLRMFQPARAAMAAVSHRQARDGSLPAAPPARWTSAPTLALAARSWALLGEHVRADRALAALAAAQGPYGAWPGSWGPRAAYFPHHDVSLAAIGFLDAVQDRVASAFAGGADDVPPRIDPRDGRAQAVRRWACELEPTARIADVGCGRGRYLPIIEEVRPRARVVAIDPSAALLAGLSSRVAGRQGSLLRLPAADGEFDAALAVESLEHALRPQRAVAELARAVRPGGSILVIDKDQSWQARCRHAPWERWFQPAELSHWLAQHCGEVRAEPLAHGPDGRENGLYWLWIGQKRHSVFSRAA